MGERPLLYDVFSGAGGATRGYQRAGFRVIGVDNRPQPRYVGDGFVQMDAFAFFAAVARGEYEPPAAWHCSPPCQGYSLSRNNGCHADAPRLIPQTRDALVATGLPYVIENVEGARRFMEEPVLICGAALGLGALGFDLSRHRLFETNWPLFVAPCCHRRGHTIGVYGNGTNSYHREKTGGNLSIAVLREAMGIDWMPRRELSQAIPPAYCELIGAQLRRYLEAA